MARVQVRKRTETKAYPQLTLEGLRVSLLVTTFTKTVIRQHLRSLIQTTYPQKLLIVRPISLPNTIY